MSWITSIMPGLDKSNYIKRDNESKPIFNIGKAIRDLDNGATSGCFGDFGKPRSQHFPRISQAQKPLNTNSLPNVKIVNNGTTGSFSVRDKTFIINQNTGSVTIKTKSGFEKTFSTMADLSGFDQDDFKNGEGVTIKLGNSRNGTLTLYPASDGIHIAKAEVVWPESKPLTRRESMQAVVRARLENKVSVENITRSSESFSKPSNKNGLKITPEQYNTNTFGTVLF